jgi:hypothetical protein
MRPTTCHRKTCRAEAGRSDFKKMATWLNLRGHEAYFELLAKFGLIPGTDSLLAYPEPDITGGRYTLEFFVHGIRHMQKEALYLCKKASEGEKLLPPLDVKTSSTPMRSRSGHLTARSS